MEHLAEEIGSKICCLLETVNTAIDVPPELEKPLYSLYQIHTVKQIVKLFNCSRYLLDKGEKLSYFQ